MIRKETSKAAASSRQGPRGGRDLFITLCRVRVVQRTKRNNGPASFQRLLQSLIELSQHGSEERLLLESLSNHIGARGGARSGRLFTVEEIEK